MFDLISAQTLTSGIVVLPYRSADTPGSGSDCTRCMLAGPTRRSMMYMRSMPGWVGRA